MMAPKEDEETTGILKCACCKSTSNLHMRPVRDGNWITGLVFACVECDGTMYDLRADLVDETKDSEEAPDG